MPKFHTERRVSHSAADMFALVSDVERYPEFVPLCQGLRITKREQEHGDEVIFARMTVAYKLFQESFLSRVRLRKHDLAIDVAYLDGPFRHLENCWTFHPLGEGACMIGFRLEYEFRSLVLQAIMGSVFDKAFRKFSAAFEARADEVYGTGTSSIVPELRTTA